MDAMDANGGGMRWNEDQHRPNASVEMLELSQRQNVQDGSNAVHACCVGADARRSVPQNWVDGMKKLSREKTVGIR